MKYMYNIEKILNNDLSNVKIKKTIKFLFVFMRFYLK